MSEKSDLGSEIIEFARKIRKTFGPEIKKIVSTILDDNDEPVGTVELEYDSDDEYWKMVKKTLKDGKIR